MHTPSGGGAGDCFFHTGRPSVTRCKQCGRPLCSDCRLITEHGVFCGNKCANAAAVFTERAENLEVRRAVRRRGVPAGLIKFIIFIIVIVVLYKIGKHFIAQGYLEQIMQNINKKPG